MDKLKTVFNSHSPNHCATAQPNFGFSSALVTQPQAMISHTNPRTGDAYMYTGPLGGTVVQFKLTRNAFSGVTEYAFRTILTGVSLTTGLGIADDLTYAGGNGDGSLMVFTDPTAVGLAGQEVVTRLPLCEDMDGGLSFVASGTGTTGIIGATGITGTTGTTGVTGATAVAGATGTTSIIGATGISGTTGTTGVTGAIGAAGITGATGGGGRGGGGGGGGARRRRRRWRWRRRRWRRRRRWWRRRWWRRRWWRRRRWRRWRQRLRHATHEPRTMPSIVRRLPSQSLHFD